MRKRFQVLKCTSQVLIWLCLGLGFGKEFHLCMLLVWHIIALGFSFLKLIGKMRRLF